MGVAYLSPVQGGAQADGVVSVKTHGKIFAKELSQSLLHPRNARAPTHQLNRMNVGNRQLLAVRTREVGGGG